jgi:hypothetical protein
VVSGTHSAVSAIALRFLPSFLRCQTLKQYFQPKKPQYKQPFAALSGVLLPV